MCTLLFPFSVSFGEEIRDIQLHIFLNDLYTTSYVFSPYVHAHSISHLKNGDKHVLSKDIAPFKGKLKQQELWKAQIPQMWKLITGYTVLLSPKKGETAVHSCRC
jgi:hypothetical protein